MLADLFKIGAIKFGDFTLKSGIKSPIYIDLRLIVSYPKLLQEAAHRLWEKGAALPFDCVCGVPYTALPIATAFSINNHVPMVMRRKEVKNYGTKKLIEGAFQPGQTCLVIEDLITSGMSIFETIEPLENEGLKVTDIIVLLDREQGGAKRLEEKGYCLHSLFTMSELLFSLEKEGCITAQTVEDVQNFVKANQC